MAFQDRDPDDFHREIESHLAFDEEELIGRGMSGKEARQTARRRFGNITLLKERRYEDQRLPFVAAFVADVRFAWRLLRRSPASTAAAILSLALGIGATTAIFSALHAVLLRPLPLPNAGDIYTVRTVSDRGVATSGLVSSLEVARLNDPSLSVDRAAYERVNYEAIAFPSGEVVPATVRIVSEGYFELFGVRMTLGRSFSSDEHARGAEKLAVISHRIWRDVYGSDANVIGQLLRMQDLPTRVIVGVAPPELDVVMPAEAWWNSTEGASAAHVYHGYLRAEPRSSRTRLESQLHAVATALAAERPDNGERAYMIQPLLDSLLGDLKPIILIVSYAAAVLLLIGAANVASLLLAKSATRSREMAVRIALGADRLRIVRQLLTESAVLTGMGALLGIGLAVIGMKALIALGGAGLPRLDEWNIDTRFLWISLMLVAGTSMAIGLTPALRLSMTDVKSLLNEGARSTTVGPRLGRSLRTMIACEIVVATALVGGAGWIVKGFERQIANGPGFDPSGRLVTEFRLSSRFGSRGSIDSWWNDVSDALRGVPGVKRVAFAAGLPLRQNREAMSFVRVVGASGSEDPQPAWLRSVSADFFETMGIELKAGRTLRREDQARRPAAAVVNVSLARQLGINDIVGKTFEYGSPVPSSVNPAYTVIGVVDDVKYESMAAVPQPTFYIMPYLTAPRAHVAIISTETEEPLRLVGSIRARLGELSPTSSLTFEALPDIVARSMAPEQFGLMVMIAFAVAALGLAGVGVYGLVAYASSQREREMAVRLALGASPSDIVRMMWRYGMRIVGVAFVGGLAATYAVGKTLAASLPGIDSADVSVLMFSSIGVGVAAMVAVALPARRASSVNVARTLSSEQ